MIYNYMYPSTGSCHQMTLLVAMVQPWIIFSERNLCYQKPNASFVLMVDTYFLGSIYVVIIIIISVIIFYTAKLLK